MNVDPDTTVCDETLSINNLVWKSPRSTSDRLSVGRAKENRDPLWIGLGMCQSYGLWIMSGNVRALNGPPHEFQDQGFDKMLADLFLVKN